MSQGDDVADGCFGGGQKWMYVSGVAGTILHGAKGRLKPWRAHIADY